MAFGGTFTSWCPGFVIYYCVGTLWQWQLQMCVEMGWLWHTSRSTGSDLLNSLNILGFVFNPSGKDKQHMWSGKFE